MAENSTLARPYAQAAFEIAQSEKNLSGWSEMLRAIAGVVADPRMQALLGSPRISKEQLVSIVTEVCGDALNDKSRNFVKLLVDNGRLVVMAEICAAFESFRAETEATLTAQVVTAFQLNGAQQKEIAAALKRRTGREVTLETSVDASLIGGVVIRAGDLVIDGSVSGQLEKLGSALTG